MSISRALVIISLISAAFQGLYGQEILAPHFVPPAGELECPQKIEVVSGYLPNNTPIGKLLVSTDGSEPSMVSHSSFETKMPTGTVGDWNTFVDVTKTTTVRAVFLIAADPNQNTPERRSTVVAATYTCKSALPANPPPTKPPSKAPIAKVPNPIPSSTKPNDGPTVTTPSLTNGGGPSIPPDLLPSRMTSWLWIPLVGVALLVLGFHLTYLHRTGGETLPNFTRMKIRPPTIGDAGRAVDQRTSEIRQFLQRRDNGGAESVEFLQVPPGLSGVERRRFSPQEPDRFWHASRLSLELENEAYLLLERVTDAIVCFARTGALENSNLPMSIQLERVTGFKLRSEKAFPWRVVIRSKQRERLFELLLNPETAKWCGIEIEIRPPAQTARWQGRCSQGSDGLEGVVGGGFENVQNAERYGVTCAHVLSSACPMSFWSGGKSANTPNEYTEERPDAAFIKGRAKCFGEHPDHEQRVTVATLEEIGIHALKETPLRKTPSTDATFGIVQQGIGSLFKLEDMFYRGPHFVIAPKFYKQFGVIFPFSRRFSSKGDSGCWVMNEKGAWLGMIVGGFSPPNTTSLAICAEHILNAFALSQSPSTPIAAVVVKANMR